MTPADPLDLVRAHYHAVNQSDLDRIAALYHPACDVTGVFLDDANAYRGRDAVSGAWARELSQWSGALAAAHRMEVACVAGMEAGWGWVRADWRQLVRASGTASAPREVFGHSHFWIEDGLIVRHRSVVDAHASPRPDVPPLSRSFPSRPVVGIGAVAFVDDGRVVLVKRRFEPLAGQWSLPGGGLEVGETLEAGVAREMREETGLEVDVQSVVDVFDRILLDEAERVRYHFVLVDYLCEVVGGTLAAGGDVSDAVLADPAALAPYGLVGKARDVIARAVTMRARPR